ncbi:MAG: protein kinase domain-containing protein [Chitinispirillaceae bacterium]
MSVGTMIGKYRIIEEIDRGGMAVVYKALQLDLEREVALKVMPANITINYRFVERFLSEAHAVAKLNHPYIVRIYEVAVENDIYYLAMEHIAGKNLYYHLHENKPKLVDVLEIVSKLAEALSYAHGQRIIHRDLKLNNVIMKDQLTPVLIDFGLAKAMEEADGGITRTGEIMGSPAYMAPERLQGGPVDHRSDICSLGIMLYEMLTFKNPYLDQRNLHQTTLNVMEANPIPPRKLVPWLPPEIEAITLKAMAKDPSMRYQTMRDFKDDIARYQKGESVLAKPPSTWSLMRRFVRKHWAPLVIGFLVLIFSGIFTANIYIQNQKEQSHWQLVYTDTSDTFKEWRFFGKLGPERDSWEVENGTLTARSNDFTYARLEKRFNRDILIKLEINAARHDLFNSGMFLFGDSPDSSYRIHLNRDGRGECGITFPGSDFLFQDIETGKIPWKEVNNIVIERIENALSLTINGVQVAKVFDFFPPLGKKHENIGFFVNGCSTSFSNLHIYRRAIPLVPKRTLIADRFWERGDYRGAIEEYQGLMIGQSVRGLRKELHVKTADCQIRLGEYEKAIHTLKNSESLEGNEALDSRAMFLSGFAHYELKQFAKSDSFFTKVAEKFNTNPVNYSIMATMLTRCAKGIQKGNIKEARGDIKHFASLYPRFSTQWGDLHLRILNHHSQQGNLKEALKTAKEISELYYPNHEVLARSKTALGKAYLRRGMTKKATEMFNQCVHTHITSDNIWEAWLSLAEIYEYNFAFSHALALYDKIRNECPPTSVISWMATLKAAELAVNDSVPLDSVLLLKGIIESPHPFPLPRLIAQYYSNQISEKVFRKKWRFLYPSDPGYLYYISRKHSLQKNKNAASVYLRRLKARLPSHSWRYFQAINILHNLNRWKPL